MDKGEFKNQTEALILRYCMVALKKIKISKLQFYAWGKKSVIQKNIFQILLQDIGFCEQQPIHQMKRRRAQTNK